MLKGISLMYKTLLYFILFLQALTLQAQVVQFQTPKSINSDGLESYTEIMVSVVDESTIEETKALYQAFLKPKPHVPSFFIHATYNPQFLDEKKINHPLNIEQHFDDHFLSTFEKNEKVELPTEWLESFLDRSPAQSTDSETFQRLEKEFHQYYKSNYRARRITLIATRSLMNGTVASMGFIAGHMPIAPAMIVGSLTGFMSGLVQTYAQPLNEYLATNKFQLKLQKLVGMKNVGEIKNSNFVMTHLKWYSIEVAFMAILDITRFSLGVLPASTTLGHEALSMGATAAKSLITQGAIDTSIAKEISPKINQAILAEDFVTASKLRFRSELASFASSVTWAGAAISDMMGMPLGDYMFMGMGGIGGGNHLRLVLKDKTNKIQKALKQAYTCSKNFFK
jgi:hypothetical protein